MVKMKMTPKIKVKYATKLLQESVKLYVNFEKVFSKSVRMKATVES